MYVHLGPPGCGEFRDAEATNGRWSRLALVTESAPPPNPYAAAPVPRAPEGTSWNTPWIWLVVFVQVIVWIPLLFINWGAFFSFTISPSTGRAELPQFFLVVIVVNLLSIGVYGLAVLFAYLDWRELGRRGVPAPFHWAWTFLGSIVYAIGRSVVVVRRTGRGHAPLWAEGGVFVLGIALSIVITAQVFTSVYENLPRR
jgi:hypothetical protein